MDLCQGLKACVRTYNRCSGMLTAMNLGPEGTVNSLERATKAPLSVEWSANSRCFFSFWTYSGIRPENRHGIVEPKARKAIGAKKEGLGAKKTHFVLWVRRVGGREKEGRLNLIVCRRLRTQYQARLTVFGQWAGQPPPIEHSASFQLLNPDHSSASSVHRTLLHPLCRHCIEEQW